MKDEIKLKKSQAISIDHGIKRYQLLYWLKK